MTDADKCLKLADEICHSSLGAGVVLSALATAIAESPEASANLARFVHGWMVTRYGDRLDQISREIVESN